MASSLLSGGTVADASAFRCEPRHRPCAYFAAPPPKWKAGRRQAAHETPILAALQPSRGHMDRRAPLFHGTIVTAKPETGPDAAPTRPGDRTDGGTSHLPLDDHLLHRRD